MTEPVTEPRIVRFNPNVSGTQSARSWGDVVELSASSDQILRHPEGRTAATGRDEYDDYSDENIRRWEEADKLDPDLAQWVKAQLGG